MSGHDLIVNNVNRHFLYETGHVMQYICVHERNLRVLQRFSSISRAFPLVFVLVGEILPFCEPQKIHTMYQDDHRRGSISDDIRRSEYKHGAAESCEPNQPSK